MIQKNSPSFLYEIAGAEIHFGGTDSEEDKECDCCPVRRSDDSH